MRSSVAHLRAHILRACGVLAAVCLLASACSSLPQSEEKRPSASSSSQATSVVAVSVDGLNPSALTSLGTNRLPNLYALIRGGASTLNARTEFEQTETLPNHTGMLTGRPITGAAGHQVTFNTDPGHVTVSSHAGTPIASVFDVVHASGARTAMYASKTKFALYARSWPDSIDKVMINVDNERLVDALSSDLVDQPARFSFVHLSAPDIAGHARGFMGVDYLDAVTQVDELVGRISAAIARSPELAGDTYVILTADHGGSGTRGHIDPAVIDDYRIPFIVDGPGVAAGADLYALNRDDYLDPGATRPAYDGAQPVRNADVANLATRLLGLSPVPGSVLGRSPLDLSSGPP